MAQDLARTQKNLLKNTQKGLLSNRADSRSGLSNSLGKDPVRFSEKKQKINEHKTNFAALSSYS